VPGSFRSLPQPLWHYHLSLDHFAATLAEFLDEARRTGATVLIDLHGDLLAVAERMARDRRLALIDVGAVRHDLARYQQVISNQSTAIWWVGDSGAADRALPPLCPHIHQMLPSGSVALCCAGPATASERAPSHPLVPWPAGHRYYQVGGPLATEWPCDVGNPVHGDGCR
jgi:hypothetical protein